MSKHPARTLALLALAAATALHAQQTPPPPPPAAPGDPAALAPLTLDQCVAMALNKNYALRIQRITADTAAYELDTAQAAFDPTLSGETGQRYVRDEFGGNTRISASASVAQKFISGATLAVSYGTYRSSGSTPTYYRSGDFGITITQPLLKNYGSTVNRAAINKAGLNIQSSGLLLKNSVLAAIRSVESAYYNLAYMRAVLDVRKVSLEVAQRLLEENRIRVSTGVLIPLDVLQAEVGVANAQNDLLTARKDVNDAEDTLLALINPFQFQAAIGPLGLEELGSIDISFERSYKLARDNSPGLAIATLDIEKSRIDVDVARQNRLPSLDVAASAGYSADRDTLPSAIGNTFDQNRHNWSIGATVSYPWGMRREKAALATARAGLDSAQISYEQADQDVLVQVRAATRAVETGNEGVRIATLAAKLSEQQYEFEKARYDQGLSTFRRVQDMKYDLDNARIAELRADVNLRNALADLARLETTSLSRYKVQLAKP